MKFRALPAIAFALALLFVACTNSEDYLYEDDDSTFIEVSAEMAYSFDSISERNRIDTLHPGDSLIFIANILPSKSIKIKRYLWTLDGSPFSYDFSFRSAIWEPGEHKIAFFLETFFGDTLSDTLTLWISNSPVLLTSAYIPANGSQGIPTTGGVSFAWNAYDPDSIANLSYRFVIDGLVDTILNVPYFTYWKNLEPLSHYRWHVQAINEFGFVSENSIDGNFFTSGGPNESGITGFIELSAKDKTTNAFSYSMKLSILDPYNNEILSEQVKGSSQVTQPFAIAPLKEGDYRVALSIPKYPDFVGDTLDLKLVANEVMELDTIRLRDTIAPQIAFIENSVVDEKADTLEYADTLKFFISDFGTPQAQKSVYAYLESGLIAEKAGSGDTFTVALPASAKSWTQRLLDVVAIDASKNKSIRHFVLEPAESWIKTNASYTLDADTITGLSSTFYIIDTNPYGFSLDSCKFIVNDRMVSRISIEAGTVCKQTIAYSELENGLNTIQSVAVYTNGISHKKKWFINYIGKK